MLRIAKYVSMAVVLVTALVGSAGVASAQGVGVKGGLVFADFNGDNIDFDKATGWQGGVYFGGNRDGVVGVLGEVNFIQKKTSFEGIDLKVNYLQVPVLLRVGGGSSGVKLYGVAGPAIDIKIGESVEGFDLEDGFEGFDIGGIVGVGVEVSRFLIEGRYTRGFRQVNNDFDFEDAVKIKAHSFAVLLGVRFN